jgi:NAD kinase
MGANMKDGFVNELPADEILDLLDKYVEEEYAVDNVRNWQIHFGDEDRKTLEWRFLNDCRIKFVSDEEI